MVELKFMTDLPEQAIAKVRELPEADQDEAAGHAAVCRVEKRDYGGA
jgi:hypothetical protein